VSSPRIPAFAGTGAGIHRASHSGLWNMGPRFRGDDTAFVSGKAPATAYYSPNTQIIVAFDMLRASGTRDSLFLALRQRPEAIAMYCLPFTE
jgi:hypothetical protein